MKRAWKKSSGLYRYLDTCNVLEKGTEEQIRSAKKAYWKEYKRAWRKQKRRVEKELTVSFNRKELKIISDEARNHKLSRTGYIKRATLAYSDKIFLVTPLEQVRRITQLLAMNYSLLEGMIEEGQIPSMIGTTVLSKVSNLEKEVLVQLHHPKKLEEWIREQASKDASVKDRIIKLLSSYEV